MTTQDTIAAVLASLAATYSTPSAKPIVVSKPKVSKVAKVKSTKSDGSQAAPVNPAAKAAPLPINMPAVGSLDAKSFLLALRDCGKRTVEAVNEVTGEVYNKPIIDPNFVRSDAIRAIHAFCGYDAAGDFGTQDVAARAEAQRQLRGIVPATVPYSRSGVSATVKRYVAGMPDNTARLLADLEGRANLALDAKAEHERASQDRKRSLAERTASATMAAVEQERLDQIKSDIEKLI